MFVKEELETFEKNRPKSKKFWEKAINVLAGGISHNIRTFGLPSIGGFPVIINSASGAYIEDIDENKYLDFWNGHFAMILGHNPPEIQEVIREHLSYGWHFGTNTAYQIELASRLIDDNPSIASIRAKSTLLKLSICSFKSNDTPCSPKLPDPPEPPEPPEHPVPPVATDSPSAPVSPDSPDPPVKPDPPV